MPKPSDSLEDVVLHDGSRARVRPLVPEDRAALRDGFNALSPETRQRRFFHEKGSVSEAELDDVSRPDGIGHLALVLEVADGAGGPWKLVAVARCFRDASDAELAEVAFVTRDEWQGLGAGSKLIRALAALAWQGGIRRWYAPMLADNAGGRRLLEQVGRVTQQGPVECGVREIICHLQPPGRDEAGT